MNGFNSKVVCKNSSVTIWEILFNITIPIIHHKYRGGLVITRGGFVKRPLSLWYAPPGRTQGGLMKTFHRLLNQVPGFVMWGRNSLNKAFQIGLVQWLILYFRCFSTCTIQKIFYIPKSNKLAGFISNSNNKQFAWKLCGSVSSGPSNYIIYNFQSFYFRSNNNRMSMKSVRTQVEFEWNF